MTSSVELAHTALVSFLEHAKQPSVAELGSEPIELVEGSYHIESTAGRLVLQAWNRDRNLSRRITGVVSEKSGLVELATERFGKKPGILQLFDAARPRSENVIRKVSRQSYGERFRRSLSRQFPGWSIQELSTSPDLEHSLSPAYPRALLRKGKAAWAAIGCPPEVQDADGVLTFGVIWLDYLRKRELRLAVRGLAVFVPQGKQQSTCLRLLFLLSVETEWAVYAYTDRFEERLDLRDYGNIDTVLPVRTGARDVHCAEWMQKFSRIADVVELDEPGGRVCWTIHGLEFARWDSVEGLKFGVETKRKGCESNAWEIEAIARELARMRSPDAVDQTNPLYMKKPELWLESQVRSAICEIDSSLEAAPVYRQAPALAGGERGILDLLAVDHAGRLAVVEVKASEDLHLPLQALDYWIRVRWHALRNEFKRAGYFPDVALDCRAPRLILVAPALYVHPAVENILRYFSPEVSVDLVGLAADWRRRVKVMFRRTALARPS